MGEKEEFFLKVEYQQLKCRKETELENHHFNSNNSGKKSSWMLKLISEGLMRNSIFIVSKYLPQK